MGLEGKSIGCKSLLYFIQVCRNSVRQLVFNLYFYFIIQQQLWTDIAPYIPSVAIQIRWQQPNYNLLTLTR